MAKEIVLFEQLQGVIGDYSGDHLEACTAEEAERYVTRDLANDPGWLRFLLRKTFSRLPQKPKKLFKAFGAQDDKDRRTDVGILLAQVAFVLEEDDEEVLDVDDLDEDLEDDEGGAGASIFDDEDDD